MDSRSLENEGISVSINILTVGRATHKKCVEVYGDYYEMLRHGVTYSESKVLRVQLHTCCKLRFLYVPVKIFS